MSANLKYSPEQVLAAIRALLQDVGIPPSIREIGEAVGISSSSHVSYYLDILESRGLIRRIPGVARGIVLVSDALPRIEDEEELDDPDTYDKIIAREWTP